VQEKKAAKQAADGAGFDSFRAIAERMIANKRGKITPKACLQFEQAFAHVYPAFGNRNIKSIGGREWLEAFQGIASRRNNRGEPMTYSALKTCQFVAQVYDYYNAENNDYIDNPCRAVIKLLARHKTANARRIDVADLPAFVCALRAYRGEFLTVCEFWLILYTGMRQASARRATWGDFDLDAATWNRKPEKHDENVLLLPLPKQAVALLREMRERARTEEKDGADWLLFHAIPKGGGNRPMSEETLNLALVRMGFDMTGHGLRGLVSTALNEYGFDARLVETQLGHKVQGVEGVYNKAQRLDERRDMMQRWADFLDALKDGKSEEEAREVFKAGAARPSAAETKKPASSDGGLWGKIFAEVYALTKDTAKATAAADRVAG
jgi:integrase